MARTVREITIPEIIAPPEAEYVSGINYWVTQIEKTINMADNVRARIPRALVDFDTDRSHLKASFVRHHAMLAVFEHHGVIDAYFGEGPLVEQGWKTVEGWGIVIRDPRSSGLYEVQVSTVLSDQQQPVEAQKVKYTSVV